MSMSSSSRMRCCCWAVAHGWTALRPARELQPLLPAAGRSRHIFVASNASPASPPLPDALTTQEAPAPAPANKPLLRATRRRASKPKSPKAPTLDFQKQQQQHQQQLTASRELVSCDSPWSRVESWVVFSDLHFSRRTRDTCLRVLDAVHAEALARKAGIIFLGDFWHARGALPVDLLNVVIGELAEWTCPSIFIPGNHDQVNMSGQMHALMVLGAVNPLIKVFDGPVEFLNALWLPFRRDKSQIKDALRQHPSVKAIFAHLDVVGAFMNEAFQAKEGIEPDVFPKSTPVFTGHYHKPHVVKDTQIEYIGSPYQISASEFGQTKRFLLLNSLWHKIGEIAIDVGGRHFVLSDSDEMSSDKLNSMRSGDRLRLLLSSTQLGEAVQANVERLQAKGVEVDLVFPALASKPRIEEAENLDALGLFNLYADRVELSPGGRSKGEEMLHSIDLPAKLIQRPQVKLVLQQVQVEGFGPYLDIVSYPLDQRGIRVVCGRNMDSVGADSNGAGKSTLVMAPLWALSGSTDPRPDSARGLSTSDVIHEKAKNARVRVEGTVNERPFMVERTAGRKSSLKLYVDGEDWTGQDMKLTQAKIDELIDTTMLQRVAFHGQYGIGGLLEASDKDFKDELSRTIAMDVWVAVKKKCLQELRSNQTEIDSLKGQFTQLQRQQEHLEKQVDECEERVRGWKRTQDIRCVQTAKEKQAVIEDLRAILAKCDSEYEEIHESVIDLEALIHRLEYALVGEMEAFHQPRNLNENTTQDECRHGELLTVTAELSVKLRNAEEAMKQRKRLVENYSLDVSGREICDKCLQRIDIGHAVNRLSQLQEDVISSEITYKVILKEEQTTKRELQNVAEAIFQKARKDEAELAERMTRSVGLQENVNRIRKCLATAQSILGPVAQFLEAEFSLRKSQARQRSYGLQPRQNVLKENRGTLQTDLHAINGGKDQEMLRRCRELEDQIKVARRKQETVNQLDHVYATIQNSTNPFVSESSALKTILRTLKLDLEEKNILHDNAQLEDGWLKELDAAFGHTGVQSYVLEAALTELQERTARFLDVLSGGTLGLLLRPTKALKRSKASVETIDRVALVRLTNGVTEQRSLRQLSGGERRRQALALALGFAEFAAHRTGLHCDLLVLDEVLQHLDSEGKARVVAVLKGLPQRTILLVSQTHGDVADAFDLVDVVVKQNDSARIESREMS